MNWLSFSRNLSITTPKRAKNCSELLEEIHSFYTLLVLLLCQARIQLPSPQLSHSRKPWLFLSSPMIASAAFSKPQQQRQSRGKIWSRELRRWQLRSPQMRGWQCRARNAPLAIKCGGGNRFWGISSIIYRLQSIKKPKAPQKNNTPSTIHPKILWTKPKIPIFSVKIRSLVQFEGVPVYIALHHGINLKKKALVNLSRTSHPIYTKLN